MDEFAQLWVLLPGGRAQYRDHFSDVRVAQALAQHALAYHASAAEEDAFHFGGC